MAPVAMLSLARSLAGCLLSSVAAAKNFSKSSLAREREIEREREYLFNNLTVVRRRSRVPISFFQIFYPQMPLDTSANCAFSPAGSFFFSLHFPNTLMCGFCLSKSLKSGLQMNDAWCRCDHISSVWTVSHQAHHHRLLCWKRVILFFFDGMSFYWKQSQHSGEPHNITLKPWKASIVEILHSQLWKFRILGVYSWRWCCYGCFRVHVWASKHCIWIIILCCTDFIILIQLLQQDADNHHHSPDFTMYTLEVACKQFWW